MEFNTKSRWRLSFESEQFVSEKTLLNAEVVFSDRIEETGTVRILSAMEWR
jgi:hypothetical protein